MSNNSETDRSADTKLTSPRDRREILHRAVEAMSSSGYRSVSQIGYVTAMAKPGAPRVEIFVDEYGQTHLT